ncbi:hypothetical protein MKW94_016836 [Papaver nudicaule]|uniref:FLZ-type domain-containing protein n=1 Tax=Papaver nudicaule TaxID=74823 RepID=A0AA41SKU7_PAPNU|nr:hypothetical protein [Papaver nudicaule]
MMLGKRPRPAVFRRTTSITEFTIDLLDVETSDDVNNNNYLPVDHQQRVLSTISPRNYTSLRSPLSNSSSQTSHFLRACGLCNRRLAPGRDIYMYRGDTAFCSLECRQQRIIDDEKKEKSAASSPYTPTTNIESSIITVGSAGCNQSGPVAAA